MANITGDELADELKMWTVPDTENGIAAGVSGIELSIKKWESIKDILDEVRYNIGGYCGLCFEHYDHGSCSCCPLLGKTGVACYSSDDRSLFTKATTTLNVAYDAATKMLETLCDIRKNFDVESKKQQEIKELEKRLKELATSTTDSVTSYHTSTSTY